MPNPMPPLPSQALRITPHMERYNTRKWLENAIRNPTPQMVKKHNMNYYNMVKDKAISTAKRVFDAIDLDDDCMPTVRVMDKLSAFTINPSDMDTLLDEKIVWKTFMENFTNTYNELSKDYEGKIRITFKTSVKIGNDFVSNSFEGLEPVNIKHCWVKIIKTFVKVNYFCEKDHEHIERCACDDCDNESISTNNSNNNEESDSDDPSI